MESLQGAAIRSSIWTIGGYGASQLIRLGSSLVLTRLLFPEIFGIVALVSVFHQGLAMFSDIGIGPAIVQSPDGDDWTFLQTAWTLQAIRGAVLWVAACAIAVPLASFYDQPIVLWLLPVSGFGAVIAGFESTAVQSASATSAWPA